MQHVSLDLRPIGSGSRANGCEEEKKRKEKERKGKKGGEGSPGRYAPDLHLKMRCHLPTQKK